MDRITWANVCSFYVILILATLSSCHSPKQSQEGLKGSHTNKFRDKEFVQDQEHVKEHLKDFASIDEKDMTPEQLEFHYFKLHDFDNNTKLDGLEILAALTHALPYDELENEIDPEKRAKNAQERLNIYTDLIDKVLEEDDYDGDGYLTYLEYVLARRREEAEEQRNEKKKSMGR